MASRVELDADQRSALEREFVRPGAHRVVSLTPRTVFLVWLSLVAIGAGLWFVWAARHVLTWIVVAAFLAVALDPVVCWLERRGVRRRGLAAAIVFGGALLVVAVLAAAFIPTLVRQVNNFVDAIPGYVHNLTTGRGPLGFLETRYHVVEHTKQAVGDGGGGITGGATTLLNVTKTVAQGVAGAVTVGFLTFFMLLEGPTWVERGFTLTPSATEGVWRRRAGEIYRVVSGYVTGNLLLSAIAATTSTLVLLALGVPFPLALGLLVFILDLIPLAGATLAAVILTLVALSHSVTAAAVIFGFFIVYQLVENHVLQPLVYGRTVQLSPLTALVSVLIGAGVGGVFGALAAIPVAGSLRVVGAEWIARRRRRTGRAGVRFSPPGGG